MGHRATHVKALVTGGAGFLGRAIVDRLIADGHTVTAASRQRYPELEQVGAHSVAMDLGNSDDVKRAIAGHEIVFHVAAKTGVWGDPNDFVRTNIVGTQNVLDACR